MIQGYIGPNGSGKTISAVTDAIDWADKLDRDVYSVLPLEWTHKKTGAKRRSKMIEDLDQLRTLNECEILLDEVVSVLSARETAVIPPKLVLAINMFRHRDVGVYWTAPSWSRADILLREVTTDIAVFTPVYRKYDAGTRWPRTVWAKKSIYDGTDNAGSRLPKQRVGLPKLVRLKGLRGFGVYAQRNPNMQKVQGSGRYCSQCGGVRKVEHTPCTC